jgi:hypothetical protein
MKNRQDREGEGRGEVVKTWLCASFEYEENGILNEFLMGSLTC